MFEVAVKGIEPEIGKPPEPGELSSVYAMT
jgi:hypothetical protein